MCNLCKITKNIFILDESHVQTPPQNFKSTGDEGGDQGGQYEEDLDFVEEPLEVKEARVSILSFLFSH